MKVLFINKYDTSGGAAIAAWRLHRQLSRQQGTEDRFLVGVKRSSDPEVQESRKVGMEQLLERGINLLTNQLGLQYVWFPFSTARIRKLAAEFEPDIIALQNIHGGYFKTDLLAELSQMAPVVWTLHDMWAITANAVHAFGDESWKHMRPGKGERKRFPSIGLNTGKWLLKRKKKIYARSRLTIVCPSRWLQDLARQSPLLAEKDIHWIPNGVDAAYFRPSEDKEAAKRQLGLDPSGKVVLLSAEKLLKSDYKGGEDLLSILTLLDTQEATGVTLLTLGHDPLPETYSWLKCRSLGYVREESRILQALQASDLYIHTSRADNLPNTLIEAISCGLPCVAFDIGGCGEIVRNGENGFLVPPFFHEEFANKIRQLLHDEAEYERFSANARRIAIEDFDVSLMADRYYELFESILDRTIPKQPPVS